jgi:hypothetical protein
MRVSPGLRIANPQAGAQDLDVVMIPCQASALR